MINNDMQQNKSWYQKIYLLSDLPSVWLFK